MMKRWWKNNVWAFVLFLFMAAYTKDLYKSLIITIVIHLLIQVLFFVDSKKKERKLRNATFTEIDTMEGLQFEHYLKALFKAIGYRVQRTSDRGDFGADLILEDAEDRIVVQAKRYKGTVGIKAVQEVIGSQAFYKANKAWVVTNSYYTPAAMELAAKAGVKLFDRDGLTTFINQVKKIERKEKALSGTENEPITPNPKVIKLQFKDEIKKVSCPKCNSKMVLRNGKRGVFYGCTRFPTCTGTKEAK